MTGRFITFEGIEGAGKSTQLAFAAKWLEEHGQTVVVTREPGGTPLAERIRDCLLTPGNEPVTNETELLLMFAARSQHLANTIRPALDKGAWVLCDRFTDATFAYQGAGRSLGQEKVAWLAELVQGSLWPGATLLFDISVEDGLKRAGKRAELDRIEQESVDFFNQVRHAYLTMAQQNSDRFYVIEGGLCETDVRSQVGAVLTDLLEGSV